MFHYVYYSYEEWGRGYIGSRSCKCSPEEDCEYFGSYKDLTFKPTQKIILMTFSSREEANQAEITLHRSYDVARNSHFANKANACATGFAVPGPVSEESKKKRKSSAIRLWGDEVYKQRRIEAMEMWRENNPERFEQRTEAMVEGGYRWRKDNQEHLAITLRKATEAARLRALANPDEARSRAHKAAQERNRKLNDDPDFDKLRLSKISKPVVLTLPTGEEINFESKLSCAQYLGVSLTPIYNKLNGKNPHKLRGYSLRLLDIESSSLEDNSEEQEKD